MKLLASIAFAAGLGMASAQAMPVPAAPLHDATGSVTQVGWRCGPGWHVNGFGRCVPSRRFYRAYGYYGGPRHYGWHRGWGHRHWHRW